MLEQSRRLFVPYARDQLVHKRRLITALTGRIESGLVRDFSPFSSWAMSSYDSSQLIGT
jgi:hypothetical protein